MSRASVFSDCRLWCCDDPRDARGLLAGDLLDGTWDLDAAASKFDPGPARKSDMRIYKSDGKTVHMIANVVFADEQADQHRIHRSVRRQRPPSHRQSEVQTIAGPNDRARAGRRLRCQDHDQKRRQNQRHQHPCDLERWQDDDDYYHWD